MEPPPGLSKMFEPTHLVFTVSSNKALHRSLQLQIDTNRRMPLARCCKQLGHEHNHVFNAKGSPSMGRSSARCPHQYKTSGKLRPTWLPLLGNWTSQHVVIIAKHSRGHGGMWRLQTFRKWRSLFIFQHARHCFCAYGIRIHSRPFRWKMKSLSL